MQAQVWHRLCCLALESAHWQPNSYISSHTPAWPITTSLTCYARSMMKEKLENSDFNVCKRCIDEIILGSQTGLFSPEKKGIFDLFH